MSDGLNNFDIVYFINLDHRQDRYIHITKELKKTNIDNNKIHKIKGEYVKNFGALGCTISHIRALDAFLKTSDNIKTCVILEDDFTFTKDMKEINNLINLFFTNVSDFDVLMLSSNILNSTPTSHSFLTKILNAQTTSGYCVNKTFAPILLRQFKESAYYLEKFGYPVYQYCIDIHMKKLQPISKWYSINPLIGKQIESYSDIENKIVNNDV